MITICGAHASVSCLIPLTRSGTHLAGEFVGVYKFRIYSSPHIRRPMLVDHSGALISWASPPIPVGFDHFLRWQVVIVGPVPLSARAQQHVSATSRSFLKCLVTTRGEEREKWKQCGGGESLHVLVIRVKWIVSRILRCRGSYRISSNEKYIRRIFYWNIQKIL